MQCGASVKRGRPRIADSRLAQALSGYLYNGLSVRQVAKVTGLGVGTVGRLVSGLNIGRPKRVAMAMRKSRDAVLAIYKENLG